MQTPRTPSWRVLVLVFVAVGWLAACGGGGSSGTPPLDSGATPPPSGGSSGSGSGDETPPVDPPPPDGEIEAIDSWSPFEAFDDLGNPIDVNWTYVVNGGAPLVVEYGTTAGEVVFDPMVVSALSGIGQRITVVSFSYTGTVDPIAEPLTGTGVIDISENLDPSGECTKILDRFAVLSFDGSSSDSGRAVRLMSVGHVATPMDWFPDCSDLDEYPVPYTTQEMDVFETLFDGMVGVDAAPDFQEDRPFGGVFETRQTWTIVERLDSLTVAGGTFTDVLVVELRTLLPDLGRPDDVLDEAMDRTARIWLVKDLGIVKATGLYRLWGQPLSIELASTSLTD